MGVSISIPVVVSNTCSVPSSLPFFDSEAATFEASGDATYQSMAVDPVGSSELGSITICREWGSKALRSA